MSNHIIESIGRWGVKSSPATKRTRSTANAPEAAILAMVQVAGDGVEG